MMRPQVRVLPALVMSMLLIGTTARAQTLLPLIVDASGNFVLVEAAEEPAEAAMEVAKPDAGTAEEEGDGEQATPAADEPLEPEEPATPPFTPEMAAFRDQIRRTLSQVYARSLSAQSNWPTEIMAFCEAFGHTAEIASGSRSGQKLNGVGAMCWNYPCGGFKLLRSDGQHVIARIGYGYQQRPAQLLAALAQIRVPASYEIRVDDHHGTLADLVASEKLACREGLDQSGTLLGLSFYTEPGETWENDLGESWSVERLLREELDREADPGRIDVMNRLMAISFALKRRKAEDISAEGLRERAEKHVTEFHDYVLGLQNPDGSWHPGFFAFRGPSKDAAGTLYSTGSILTWLVYSLPEERLEDERVVLGLTYLNKQLAYRTSRRSSPPSSAREVVGWMNAARALSLYDVRYFTPRTPKEPAETAESTEAQQAQKTKQPPTPLRTSSNGSSRSRSGYSSRR